MSTDGIDAKKLREAIGCVRGAYCPDSDLQKAAFAVCDAAEAHLATLPREVEVETWATIRPSGELTDTWDSRDRAEAFAERYGYVVVHLTGTAVLPKG